MGVLINDNSVCLQTSASPGFIERVKYELFEIDKFKPSQAWVFPTSEILKVFFKSKTQYRLVTISLWRYQSWFKFQTFWDFLFKPHLSPTKLFTFYWVVWCGLWLNLIDLNWNCCHLFNIYWKLRLYFELQKETKNSKRLEKYF